MIEVINRQRKLPIDCARWEAFTARALKAAKAPDEDVTIVFISDRAMRPINREWRGKRGTTDVLSFSAKGDRFDGIFDRLLGDVIISVEQAARQAAEHALDFDREIAQLILHGLLHLCGYDHETDKGQMNRLELRLRRRLGI
jgi:probable rRNA maturation factor